MHLTEKQWAEFAAQRRLNVMTGRPEEQEPDGYYSAAEIAAEFTQLHRAFHAVRSECGRTNAIVLISAVAVILLQHFWRLA